MKMLQSKSARVKKYFKNWRVSIFNKTKFHITPEEIILKSKGKHFDSQIVDALVAIEDEVVQIAKNLEGVQNSVSVKNH